MAKGGSWASWLGAIWNSGPGSKLKAVVREAIIFWKINLAKTTWRSNFLNQILNKLMYLWEFIIIIIIIVVVVIIIMTS